MSTITKKELVERIAHSTGQKRVVVKKIVQQFLDEVAGEVSNGNRLEFRDFGVFEVKDRAPRMAQNPKTLERVPVPAKRTVKFKPGRRMRIGLEAHPPEHNTAQNAQTSARAAANARRAGETSETEAEIHVNPALNGSPVAAPSVSAS